MNREFYNRDCVTVARELVGKVLIHDTEQGQLRLRISETEAYWARQTPLAMPIRAGRNARRCCTLRRGPSIFICATGCTGC